ncbi:MAG: universal stress protein [Phormidesmis sp.]
MFKKILVGIDDGETCQIIFNKAIALAQPIGAELSLLSVLVPADRTSPAIPTTAGGIYTSSGLDDSVWSVYQERYEAYEASDLDRLRDFADRANAVGVKTEFAQMAGSPGWAICERAKLCGADLVMVGSHGRMGLSEMLLGSVSNYVMHHAACSVLVVHEPV